MAQSLVLIAEDDETNRADLTRQVEGLGCIFEVAKNGEEAVAASTKKTFGVILLNCDMGGSSNGTAEGDCEGVEAARQIRHAEKGRQSRSIIVGITRKGMPADRQTAFDAGVDEILVRPYSLLDLKELLGRWVTLKDEDYGAAQTFDSIDALKDPQQDAVRVEAFRKSLSNLMQKLFMSVHNQDAEDIKTAAREMKGLCHSCGFPELGDWCSAVEKAVEAGDWVQVQAAFNSMVDHYRDKGL